MADDFKSSSDEETDRSNDEAGTGRSYECVFCKRGFTTAQALGGHMNIHRKDRAKPRQNSTSISADYYYANLRGFPAIQTYAPPAIQVHYQNFLPAEAGWGFRPPIGEGFCVQSPQNLNHVEVDWPRDLSLKIGPSDHVNGKRGDDSEADELDLELRLGHHDH